MVDKKIVLSEHETELLKGAVLYFQKVWAEEKRAVSQEELQRELKCARASAKNLQEYLLSMDAGKIATRLKRLPEAAEERALINYGLGVPRGTLQSYIVRENIRLVKALAKAKHENLVNLEVISQDVKDEIDALKGLAKKRIKRKPLNVKPPKQTGLMLEVNIPDLHAGKLSWPVETGGAPYDLKIAEATHERALDTLLRRAAGYSYEQVLFVIGNDVFHSNDAQGNTANGTRLDTEGRFQKTYWTIRKMLCRSIERLSEMAPVKVVVVSGNHDKLSAWTLGDSLECYFHNDTRVSINNAPTYRKYYEWGKVMLLLTHGDLGKHPDYPLLMATEQSEMFGRTLYREVHTGHLHTTKTEEYHGVRVRILPSLTAPDAWHAENAFVGNQRNAEAYVWSKEEGLITQFFYNDLAFSTIKTKREIV